MEVDRANSSRLNQLPGPPITFQAQDYPGYDSKGQHISLSTMERLLDRLVVPKTLYLKVRMLPAILMNLTTVKGRKPGDVGQGRAIHSSISMLKVTRAS
jgi:hypothetical protein